MIKEGKGKKYLLYAIGEIMLVMIGILLALQVNNWNEEKKQVRVKNQLVSDLKLELKIANSQIDKILVEESEVVKKRLDFFNRLNNDSLLSADSLSLMLKGFLTGLPFSLQLPSYEESKASGKLSLLKSKDVIEGYSKIYVNAAGYELHREIGTKNYFSGSTYEMSKNVGGYEALRKRNTKLPGNIRLSDVEYQNYILQADVYAALKIHETLSERMESYLAKMNDAILATLEALGNL